MARGTQMSPANDDSPAYLDANDATPPPPAPSSAPYGLQFGLGRHRRLLNSQTRSTATNTFNPEAVEFVPCMPSKRKASTSATPGNSRLAIHDAAHGPLIMAKDLLATADMTHYDGRSATLERLLTDLATEGGNVRQTVSRLLPPLLRRSQSMQSRHSRLVTDPRVVDKTPPNLSVILVSSPPDGSLDRRIRYLPLCSAFILDPGQSSDHLTILPTHQSRILASSNVPSHVIWPSDRVPAEMFDQITLYLARDDVKSMRLVNHEFERKVSRSLFHTSVVPFNTELYDMVGDEAKTVLQRSEPEPVGKGKARASQMQTDFAMSHTTKSSLHWRNAKEDDGDKIYRKHGLRVFQGFGPHIRRFGMSFEVSENQLLQLPIKKELDHVDAYYGDYDWPPPHYTRFDRLAGLEHTADETSRMKSAFDKLEIVQELALSVDSGLGYMNGPDLSLHARVFRQPAAVFGSENVSDHEMQAALDFWAAMQQSQQSLTTQDVKEVSIAYRQLDITPAQLDGLEGTVFADTRRWSSIDAHRVLPDGASVSDTGSLGVLYTNAEQLDILSSLGIDAVVIPNDLRKEQKEWLLETEWAQRAFLESYMLAVIDNPSTFENVTCLNIARLSGGFLSTITQQQFWDALPSLQAVTLLVSPHWRSVAKDNAGQAETTVMNPSAAVTDLYHVLRSRLSRLMLKKLNIGWVDGGEHAPGMLARNANILPAPIIQLEQSMAANAGNGLLIFEHVEELTLTNCWMTPVVLEDLVRRHAAFNLRKLVLSSVSLTAHPRASAPAHPPAAPHLAHGQIHQQQPQQMNFGLPPWLNGMPQPMNAQQLAHMQQQWQHLAHLQHQATAGHPGANAPMVNPNLLPHPFTTWLPLPALPTAHTNPSPPPQPPHPDPSLLEGHREGSWPSLLARIFPPPHHAHDQPPPPPSNLQSLTLISCGYLRLNAASFNQSSLSDPSPPLSYTPWFRARHATLKPFMLESKERYLGAIVQFMPLREVDALHLVWGLREGWEDGVKAAEAEFDGLARGGTGRISGTVRAVGE
ncbi:hypothetical protein B0A54_13890 [Friedmanniomyces endolithicus]|uniref:F-box domain-containing protein n=1 Tax=Friedmanniomyces endolithicus TaxID=329885 RepID=A0A4U0UHP7_9PEZI|nr:hypothetical protein LTS09_001896 [Friedmanniomyces endolithicus]KAK0312927.1 hypothetical protein LTR01_002590 [Friedmanniomyces endolithicus]KAK0828959.1 hypothetical protein LTR73_004592 [Friedmanniomyces endolithicus]TKA34927.1 hypothetical protein B0A54_13890 [Friedmanniomyces endolithicus]